MSQEYREGRVAGKVVVVTGAASDPGLGHSSAIALAREGARLVVTDLDAEGAERCAEKIRKLGGDALALHHDVTDEEKWTAVIGKTIETFGRLDVLVNNAGIAVLKPLAELSLADWDKQISVNLTSVFLGCKSAALAMGKSGGGSIVNLSSVAGLIGLPNCSAYAASKGGVRLMTKALAAELGPQNIRCNSVHPGVIWTNMQAGAGGGSRDNAERMSASLPLARLGEPQDIANIVVYLASDEANYVTGGEFVVDGGMTAV